MIKLYIDGQEINVKKGTTILEAARQAGIKIPTLCHFQGLHSIGACRICVVEVEGLKNLQPACITQVRDQMKIKTNSGRVRAARTTVLELILSNHPQDCLQCVRNSNCELRQIAVELGATGENEYAGYRKEQKKDEGNPSIVRDSSKCILCRRCETVCHQVQGVAAVGPLGRGFDTVIAPAFGANLDDSACVLCGQCINVCPTGALTEKSYLGQVWSALDNPALHVVVQVAPAVRIALGEEFGLEPGAIVTGKLVAALKRLGFNRVFDTDFTADLTIMEEGTEFLTRLNQGGTLPLITSCSPGWINFIETFYPELLPNLSTCKSPQQMFGALMKTYYAEVSEVPAEQIYTVSVMPCTAKKYECERPEMQSSGYKDVDAVLTTRELGRMIKQAGSDWLSLTEERFHVSLGEGSGAGGIFGASGGVVEEGWGKVLGNIVGNTLANIDFTAVRGLEGIKEAEVQVGDLTVKVAITNGLANARKLLDLIKSGAKQYHFIEIMACPGGCLGGGGQPLPITQSKRLKRMEAVYQADRNLPLRKAHENPYVAVLYEKFLGKPLGERSHKLLHTHYQARNK